MGTQINMPLGKQPQTDSGNQNNVQRDNRQRAFRAALIQDNARRAGTQRTTTHKMPILRLRSLNEDCMNTGFERRMVKHPEKGWKQRRCIAPCAWSLLMSLHA